MEKRRRTIIATSALLLAMLAIRHPTADVRLMLHDVGDRAPRRIQTALDTGLMGVSLLITWTERVRR